MSKTQRKSLAKNKKQKKNQKQKHPKSLADVFNYIAGTAIIIQLAILGRQRNKSKHKAYKKETKIFYKKKSLTAFKHNMPKFNVNKRYAMAGVSVALACVIVWAVASAMPVQPQDEKLYAVEESVAQSDDNTRAIDANSTEDTVSPAKEQWLIKIGGEAIVAVETKEDAEAVFEGIKNYYVTDEAAVEQVDFDKEFTYEAYNYNENGDEAAWELDVAGAIDYIMTGAAEKTVHVVQAGDTFGDIANMYGVSIAEIQEMNPGVSSDALKIGQEVNLFTPKPYINVKITETVIASETIPYDTVYEYTEELYKGQTQVTLAGVEGSKETVNSVVKENGVLIATTVVSETVNSEPQSQYALTGTAAIPAVLSADGSTGTLSAPMASLTPSSHFGASRGSRSHAGVDLTNPKGTPVYSSADGVVISAAYNGDYGNIIKVDHGGGLQTYYAHLDTMSVEVGQFVTRGELLGTVGKTGNATGYLLHFEVRVNGVAQNPLNYL